MEEEEIDEIDFSFEEDFKGTERYGITDVEYSDLYANGNFYPRNEIKTNIALGVSAAVGVGVANSLRYTVGNGKIMTEIKEDVPKTIIKEDTHKTIIIDIPKTIINENNSFIQGISLLILSGFLLYISK